MKFHNFKINVIWQFCSAHVKITLIRITFRLPKNGLCCSLNQSTLTCISLVLLSLQFDGKWCMYNQYQVFKTCNKPSKYISDIPTSAKHSRNDFWYRLLKLVPMWGTTPPTFKVSYNRCLVACTFFCTRLSHCERFVKKLSSTFSLSETKLKL
jgi:hypothetical protein